MRIGFPIVVLLAGAMLSCTGAPSAETVDAGPGTVVEASGVTYRNGELMVVDDSAAGTYFTFPFSTDTPSGTVITINSQHPRRVELKDLIIWIDLEGIGVLADNRVVVLSERLRSIVSDDGVVAEYDYPLAEMGRRGLEGLAVDPLPDGGSHIAVLWEGGYADPGSLNPQVAALNGDRPFLPMIFIHDLPAGEVQGRVPWDAGTHFLVNVPRPEGVEPDAQRFRAPDLVWFHPGGGESSFILLLSSQNASEPVEYRYHWLQRFDLDGNPVGEPLDIAAYTDASISGANWEGVCRLVPGEKLVLVHEGLGDLEAHALVVDIPEDWRGGGNQ